MSIYTTSFDSTVAAIVATGANKSTPHNFYHTWDGWVSRGVLHVVSRSGAKRRPIWHFEIARHSGRTLCLKNTTGIADCWTKSAGANALEIFVQSVNPLARVEYADTIDVSMLLYGRDCGHNPGNDLDWWRILTDGEVTIIRDAPRCERGPRHHIGCPEGTADARVVGGTYAVQWRNIFQLRRVVVTPDADLEQVALHIRVQHDLWNMGQHPAQFWRPEDSESLVRLAVFQARTGALTEGQVEILVRLMDELNHRNVVPGWIKEAIGSKRLLAGEELAAAEEFAASRMAAFREGGEVLAQWMCKYLPIYRSEGNLLLGSGRDGNRIEVSNPETFSQWWIPARLGEYRNDVTREMLLRYAQGLGNPVSLKERFGTSRSRMCYEVEGGIAFDCSWNVHGPWVRPEVAYSMNEERARSVRYLFRFDVWAMDRPEIWILN